MDDGGYLKPDEIAFVVVVDAAPPVEPAARVSEAGHGNGGVEQGAPSSARAAGAERCGDVGESFMILLGSPQAAAGGEQGAEIVGEAFVDPEQVCLHGRFVRG